MFIDGYLECGGRTIVLRGHRLHDRVDVHHRPGRAKEQISTQPLEIGRDGATEYRCCVNTLEDPVFTVSSSCLCALWGWVLIASVDRP